jgi:ligand-binding sensor domain-containing protein
MNLYAATSDGGLFRSSDGGATWTTGSPLPISSVQALAFDPRSSAVFAGTDQGVFRSTDGGATWSAVNTGLATLYVQTFALDSARETLYAGTYGGSVFALPLTVSPPRPPAHVLPLR